MTALRMVEPYLLLAIFASIVVGVLVYTALHPSNMITPSTAPALRYVSLGDSYTYGEGASRGEAWPAVLARDLSDHGFPTELVANPAVTGWTTQQLIDNELPVLEHAKPQFVTMMIGTNDWVQGVDEITYRAHLKQILDRVQAALPDKRAVVLVTVPDYSVTPTGRDKIAGRDAAAGLSRFNEIVKEEAGQRNLPVVDIFRLSQAMGTNPELLADDQLHPSAKEYGLWEQAIFPTALQVVRSLKRAD